MRRLSLKLRTWSVDGLRTTHGLGISKKVLLSLRLYKNTLMEENGMSQQFIDLKALMVISQIYPWVITKIGEKIQTLVENMARLKVFSKENIDSMKASKMKENLVNDKGTTNLSV